jgi:Cell wall-associated hydrolases (invasion-associated proteins)
MRKSLCLLLFVCAVGAHAAPAAGSADEMDKFLTDNGLLGQWNEMRSSVAEKAHSVADRASDLVVNAMGFLGVPYRRGGSSAETGFDCSGFVRAIYQQTVGLVLPRSANQQAANTQVIERKSCSRATWCFSTPCAAHSAMSGFTWVTASSSTHHAAAPRCAWKTCRWLIGSAASTVRAGFWHLRRRQGSSEGLTSGWLGLLPSSRCIRAYVWTRKKPAPAVPLPTSSSVASRTACTVSCRRKAIPAKGWLPSSTT